MHNIRLTKLLHKLPATVPFIGPETQERYLGKAFSARLGANENVFGTSPKAISAMQSATSEIWKYGDPTSYDLRSAIAEILRIDPINLIVGEGIDGLLGYLVRMIIESGDNVVTSDGAYPTFNYHVAGFGGVLHKVPYKNDCEDLEGLLEKVKSTNAKLVYLANPDNPMGTAHKAQMVEKFIQSLPESCLLALDEAYIEFASHDIPLQTTLIFQNVIRFRTFSKAYGMAGARVGYAFGPSGLIAQFEKVRNHFGMNRVAQVGALAALKDDCWLSNVLQQVTKAKAIIKQIASQNSLTTVPSETNFVAIDCGNGKAFAKAVLTQLVEHGVFVRMPLVSPQDRCIRVSAGAEADLDFFAKVFPKALELSRSSGFC